MLGPYFGPDDGKPNVVVRALYMLKRYGASFWNHLNYFMNHMEYMKCTAHPDLWINPMVRQSDGSEYYAYILLYVDDILCIHHDAESVLLKVDKYFKLKLDSIRKLDMYMGAKIRLIKLDNGV